MIIKAREWSFVKRRTVAVVLGKGRKLWQSECKYTPKEVEEKTQQIIGSNKSTEYTFPNTLQKQKKLVCKSTHTKD